MGSQKMTVADAFAELGLEPGADATAIKRAYKKAALKWHPDKNAGSEEATAKFRRIALAHHVLEQASSADFVGEGESCEDFERTFRMPTFESIFKMAVGGADPGEVEELLQAAGQYRPPEGFGCAPFPPFQTHSSVEEQRLDAEQRAAMRDPKYAAAYAAAKEELGSDDSDATAPDVDMEQVLRNMNRDDGLDSDCASLPPTPPDSDSDE
mmetsp:Transcript_28534/g.93239  ORF Transcript_28534/g.93239 Transcript_28534/m.93239 type:complete len:210 (+) Transcript_28534:30-659(+)